MGVGYSIWAALNPKHWREAGRFIRELIKPAMALLVLVGFSLVLQGIGVLTGWDGLQFVGRTFGEVFGGS